MLSTGQLRAVWGPVCTFTKRTVSLYGAGRVTVDARIVVAVAALNDCLIAFNYRTRQADTGAYVCRRITGGTGYSLHAYGIALDINWQSNPYGQRLVTDMPPAMVAAIKAIRTQSGEQVWGWGGDYRSVKDAMHFEVVCTPAHIATGIVPFRPVERFLPMLSDAEQRELLSKVREIHADANATEQRSNELARIVHGAHRTTENPNGDAKGTMLGRLRDEAARTSGLLKAVARKVGVDLDP